MLHHVIVDGSNLATEGRTLPSLHQLNDAVAAYRADHPDTLITVVVDATFGHRIDQKESAEFERAIETNAFVAPPAGAVGRGDGFILSIAQKAGASILSNDSYQEFHGEYAWLFDEGRLIGGKPVPHVGWVFVNRVPVRGPISRRSVKEQKIVDKSPSRGRGRKSTAESSPAISADGPMPVPKSAPPGAVMASGKSPRGTRQNEARSQPKPAAAAEATASGADQRSPVTAAKSTNDLAAFFSFVEQSPVGTVVSAVVESYSSHGAYVAIGDAKGYVPLRLMADPAPRSAREVMAIGETVTLVVSSFGAARRSIDLAVPAMAPPAPEAAVPKPRKAAAKRAGSGVSKPVVERDVAGEPTSVESASAAQGRPAKATKATKAPKARPAKKAADLRTRPKSTLDAGETPSQATFDNVFEEPIASVEATTPARPTKSGRLRKSAAITAAITAAADKAGGEKVADDKAAGEKSAGAKATATKATATKATATKATAIKATATKARPSARAAKPSSDDAKSPADDTKSKSSGSAKSAARPVAKSAARPAAKAAATTEGSPARTRAKPAASSAADASKSTAKAKANASSGTTSDAAAAPKRGSRRRQTGTSGGS